MSNMHGLCTNPRSVVYEQSYLMRSLSLMLHVQNKGLLLRQINSMGPLRPDQRGCKCIIISYFLKSFSNRVTLCPNSFSMFDVMFHLQLSDLKEKYEWAENNPRLAQRISERATLFARSLGTLDGFEEMYNQYYEHPLRSVVEAYEPLEGESWRDAMTRLTGENMVPVMKCTGYMPDGTDCDTLTDQPIEWKKFS